MPLPLLGIPGALAIGVSLGLLGSGGSILTVPVLVYLFGQDEKQAVAGSLLVVGVIALAGALGYLRRRAIDVRAVAVFGIPGSVAAFGGAWASQFIPGSLQLALFALIMLAAAAMMLRRQRAESNVSAPDPAVDRGDANAASAARSAQVLPVTIAGIGVGTLTGLIGVGGGFLIVPALIAAARLDMSRAVGTSLGIIALNCAVGFAQHSTALEAPLDWVTLGIVSAIGVAGSLAGQRLGANLPQAAVRRVFGIMLLVIGAAILIESAPRVRAGRHQHPSATRELRANPAPTARCNRDAP
jgi:uncharacterized membrane protein YfcA